MTKCIMNIETGEKWFKTTQNRDYVYYLDEYSLQKHGHGQKIMVNANTTNEELMNMGFRFLSKEEYRICLSLSRLFG